MDELNTNIALKNKQFFFFNDAQKLMESQTWKQLLYERI